MAERVSATDTVPVQNLLAGIVQMTGTESAVASRPVTTVQ